MKYELKSNGEGYFTLSKNNLVFGIEDYHIMEDYTGPMKFKKEDALKLQRFLNNYCSSDLSIVHWKLYDKIQRKLHLTTGVYAR